ncbi:MAG: Gfo/Idh/MocA family oxidoreductase [Planctomycetota bacterium]
MRRLRFGIIGSGRAGLVHARNLATLPRGEVVAACDPIAATREAVAEELELDAVYDNHADLLADTRVDAVVITTPTFLHRETACDAAAAGKHIFLEKPMALTLRECDAINQAVAGAHVKLQIGFMRRFDRGFRRAKKVIDAGTLGRIMIIKSTGRGPGGPGPWMWDLTKSNGIVAEVNSHDLDTLHWLTGQRPVRAFAEADNFKMPEAAERFPDFYDNVVATLRFEDGAIGVVDGTCPAGYGYDARVEVLGEHGVLFIGSSQDRETFHITVDGEAHGRSFDSWRTLFRDAYRDELAAFIDAVLDDQPTLVNGQDGRAAVAAVLAINESIQTGAPVSVPIASEVPA